LTSILIENYNLKQFKFQRYTELNNGIYAADKSVPQRYSSKGCSKRHNVGYALWNSLRNPGEFEVSLAKP